MTDLTADLESSGIPTLDHKNYIMKVFFPGVSDHPILNDPKVRRYLDEGIVLANFISQTSVHPAWCNIEHFLFFLFCFAVGFELSNTRWCLHCK
jgi:hypothetical protein